MTKILVTSSTGFIGSNFFVLHKKYNYDFVFLNRNLLKKNKKYIKLDLNDEYYDDKIFKNIDIVIHIAGQAHTSLNSKKLKFQCKKINYDATIKLAKYSEKNGVKKFVFLSSVKAAGNIKGKRLKEDDYSSKIDLYGKFKRDAEKKLIEISSNSNMNVSIIRSSLVYGPEMKGNLKKMLQLISTGFFPIPQETIKSQSMIHVSDLIDSLIFAAINKSTNNQIYNVTDGTDYSFREIYENLSVGHTKNKVKIVFPRIFFLSLAMLGSIMNFIIRFPFTLVDYRKLFTVSTFSSQKIRNLGFKTKFKLNHFSLNQRQDIN